MQNHIRKFVLAELSRFKDYKKQLYFLEQEKKALYSAQELTSQSDNKQPPERVSDFMPANIAMLQRADASTARIKFYIQAIEDTLSSLPETRRRFIEFRCIEGYSEPQVEAELFVAPGTQRLWLTNILPLFAVRMGL